jgi:hypothetical protein
MGGQQSDSRGFCIGYQPTLRLHVAHLDGHGDAWCAFRAEAVAPGFKADFSFDAQLAEFAALADQIQEMDKTLQGAIQFETLKANLSIDAKIDHLGHVLWSVALRVYASLEVVPELTFSIEGDQTMLKGIAEQISQMIQSAQAAAS